MTALISTTIIAVAAIASATVAVCCRQIDVTDYIAIVGAFGGGLSAAHVAAASTGKTQA